MWEAIFFYGFATIAVVTALLMILMKNPVVSAIYLVVTFFSLAGLYVLLNAQLLAALQVLVYAGAIMVLFLFVIMLLNLNRKSFTSYKLFFTKAFAILVVFAILFVMGQSISAQMEAGKLEPAPRLQEGSTYLLTPETEDHVQTLGSVLFSRYIYPFEIMAIMLLAGVIGAVLITRKGKADGNRS
jgi:NADH-quinone oxidoreductase subunit J